MKTSLETKAALVRVRGRLHLPSQSKLPDGAATVLFLVGSGVESQAELRKMIRMDAMTLSQTVKSLSAKGLISSKQSHEDRRIRLLSLTKNGAKRFEVLRNEISTYERAISKELGGDAEVFLRGLGRVVCDEVG